MAGDDDPPIIPLVVGAADIAMRLYRRLLEAGIYAMAIRPPTVPDGTCRIRFTLSASHRREHLETLLAALGPAPGIT